MPFYEKVEIKDFAAEGKAIAKINEIVVFVTGAVPGDIVDIQINKKRKRYQEGYITKLHSKSEKRIEAVCEHFGVCGGCKWQFLDYTDQAAYKQQQVVDSLTRIGKIELPEVSPILTSEKNLFYRNKLEFTFTNKRWLTQTEVDSEQEFQHTNGLGFHVPGRFDKVVNIEKCYLQSDLSNQIRNTIREYALQNDLDFFDLRSQEGFLRNLIIRSSTTGDLMVIVVFFKEQKDERIALLDFLGEKFPQISSLMYIINQKANDSITDQNVLLHKGNDHIFEQMEDLRFKIGAKSFYQTNSEQAYELYKEVREYAELQGIRQ